MFDHRGGFGDGLTLGPGYRAIAWTLEPKRAIALIAALFVLRALATALTVGGGGAGGLFIPLFVQGWLLGRFIQHAWERRPASSPSLVPLPSSARVIERLSRRSSSWQSPQVDQASSCRHSSRPPSPRF
ncbi:MAG: chloride channel protein [Actinomycetota bacterium]|nr:chloride channel protein [Actinomycetota bacterium]